MVWTFTPVPPRKTVAQLNADFQSIADAVNAITSTGVGAGGYTYIVGKSGAVYEAYNNQATLVYGGAGDAGGADGDLLEEVIQACIDNGGAGASIAIAPQTLTLTADGIDMNVTGQTLFGFGYGSRITQVNGADINIMVDVSADAVTIENLYLEGNYANNVDTIGIKLSNVAADYFTLRNSWIWHFPGLLVSLAGGNTVFNIHHNYISGTLGGSSVLLSGSADGWLHHNSIAGGNAIATGIVHMSSGAYINIDHNKLFGTATNYLYLDGPLYCNVNHNIIGGAAPVGTGDLIDIVCTAAAYGKYNIIADNNLYGDATNRDGIRLTGNEVKYNDIHGNTISNIDDVGINSFSQSDYNYIHDNYFYTVTTPIAFYGVESIWRNNYGAKFGVVANKFQNATNILSPKWGNQATPSASTDYTVKLTDVILYSTDSGNSDCAIVIDNEDGVPVSAAMSTLNGVYVPVGYTVNWGAYTGAAPTVTASFLG